LASSGRIRLGFGHEQQYQGHSPWLVGGEHQNLSLGFVDLSQSNLSDGRYTFCFEQKFPS
jgi:hypothetical protein